MAERPDIAVVVDNLLPYGSQRVAARLAAAFAELGLATTLVTIEPRRGDELEPAAGIDRVSLVRPRGGALGYLAIVAKLRSTLRRLEPRLVVSHMMLANVVCAAGVAALGPRRRPRLVLTEHSRPSERLPEERSPRALQALGRLLYPRADHVVGVSHAVADDARALFRLDANRVSCIMNPLDLEHVRALGGGEPPHPWLEDGASGRTIVCVGEFRAGKGQDVLVRALRHVPDARAVFVGGGSGLEDARTLAAEVGVAERVAFAGFRADAPSYIAHGSVLAVPSRREGFGLVAIEAAALGVPVVGSAVAGLDEVVPFYAPGELVAPEDPLALAGALRRALERRDHDLAPRGASSALERFAPHAVARAYLEAAGWTR
jgi:glycosyltransferase involved in cell wall biosynthesis